MRVGGLKLFATEEFVVFRVAMFCLQHYEQQCSDSACQISSTGNETLLKDSNNGHQPNTWLVCGLWALYGAVFNKSFAVMPAGSSICIPARI
jgi:hypothetical protein